MKRILTSLLFSLAVAFQLSAAPMFSQQQDSVFLDESTRPGLTAGVISHHENVAE
jgi:hypothetical protein